MLSHAILVNFTSQSSYKFDLVTECKLAGCLLAEEMLGFTHHRPIRLAISLASLPAAEMVAWARNHMLHRVVESALLSPSVPEQRKLQIFACLKVSPYSSHFFRFCLFKEGI